MAVIELAARALETAESVGVYFVVGAGLYLTAQVVRWCL